MARTTARATSLLGDRQKRLQLANLPLVGREMELQLLREAIDSTSCPLVTIAGHSGVGKTALVLEASITAADDEESSCWFTVGKYDQQASSRPYAGVSLALSQLASKYGAEIMQALTRKENALTSEQIFLMLDVVPSLKHVFDSSSNDVSTNTIDDDTVYGTFRSERIQNALLAFMRTICEDDLKIIMLLDDVQWADSASLDFVEKLLVENETMAGLTVVLTYRSNELQGNRALQGLLSQFRSSLSAIQLDNLPLEHMNILVAHILELRPDEEGVLDLTKAIQQKTEGNVVSNMYMNAYIFVQFVPKNGRLTPTISLF